LIGKFVVGENILLGRHGVVGPGVHDFVVVALAYAQRLISTSEGLGDLIAPGPD